MTIRPDVKDALSSACSVGHSRKLHTLALVRQLTLAVVRELPDEMTIAELRDELETTGPGYHT